MKGYRNIDFHFLSFGCILMGLPLVGLIISLPLISRNQSFKHKELAVIGLVILSLLISLLRVGKADIVPMIYLLLSYTLYRSNIRTIADISDYVVFGSLVLHCLTFLVGGDHFWLGDRFQSFFLEPSYLALICGYALILRNRRIYSIESLIHIALILSTKSFIGLLFVSVFILIRAPKRVRVVLFLTFAIFSNFIFTSKIGLFNRDLSSDLSLLIRLLYPLEIMKIVFLEHKLLFGLGYGQIDNWILDMYLISDELNFFIKRSWDGSIILNTNVDNILYNLVLSLGVLIVPVFFLIRKNLRSFWINDKSEVILLILLVFSSGHVIGPLFIYHFSKILSEKNRINLLE